MEQFNGIYDGALCLCGAGAGATRLWDSGVPVYLASNGCGVSGGAGLQSSFRPTAVLMRTPHRR
jgi:hypothetical protein